MKDYAMNEEDRKFFVRGFKLNGKGNFIVRFSKHVKNDVPRNEKNERVLLAKMEEQVRNSDKCLKKTKKIIQLTKLSTIVFGFIFLLLLNVVKGFGAEELGKQILTSCFTGIAGGCTVVSLVKYVNSKLLLADLRKNRKFMAIKDSLNSNVKVNKNMLANTSSKTKKMVFSTPDEKDVFNINSFNNVPYRDLMKIMDNIERDKKFEFDYDDVEVISKPKTRKKVR